MTTFTNNGFSNNATLTHEAYSITELNDCIKAAKVFGLVVGSIEASGMFSDRTNAQVKEDKITHDWYENSEHNNTGVIRQFTDENTSIYSYYSLKSVKGKTLNFSSRDSNSMKVWFPLYPIQDNDRDQYTIKPSLIIKFVTPDDLN